MRKILSLSTLLILYAAVVPNGSPCAAQSEQPLLPDAVREALAKNATALSPIRMDWRLHRTSKYKLDALIEKIGSKRFNFLRPSEAVTVIDGIEYYRGKAVEHADPSDGSHDSFVAVDYITSFDGNLFFNIDNGDLPTRSVSPGADVLQGDVTEEPLRNIGVRRRTGFVPDSDILAHPDEGGWLLESDKQSVDDTRCLVLTLIPREWSYAVWKNRKYRYYLAAEKNYAVKQIDWLHPDSRIIQTTNNGDWIQLSAPDVWIPRRSTQNWHTYYLNSNEHFDDVIFKEIVEVTDLSRNLTGAPPFHPDLDEPGVLVSDFRPEAATKPGAQWNEASEKWEYTNPPDTSLLSSVSGSGWRTTLIVINVVVFGFIAFRLWRRAA